MYQFVTGVQREEFEQNKKHAIRNHTAVMTVLVLALDALPACFIAGVVHDPPEFVVPSIVYWLIFLGAGLSLLVSHVPLNRQHKRDYAGWAERQARQQPGAL